MHLPKACLLALLTPLLFASHSVGAVITWQTPQDVNVNDTTQVSLDGTLFVAATYFGSDVTANGVLFKRLGTAANFTFGAPDSGQGGSITTQYSKLVSEGGFVTTSTAASSPSIFTGLTIGQTYQIQIWAPAWNSNWTTRYSSLAPDGAVPGTAPDQSPGVNVGYDNLVVEQYILGSFVANATTQSLYQFGTSTYAGIASVQLRAVPEPQTWALAALGVSAVVIRLRRRQKA